MAETKEKAECLDLTDFNHSGIPLRVVVTCELDEKKGTAALDAQVFTQAVVRPTLDIPKDGWKDAEDYAYHAQFSQGKIVEVIEDLFSMNDLFPTGEVFTLLHCPDKTCVGLFRTKQDAEKGREAFGTERNLYLPLRIDFTC